MKNYRFNLENIDYYRNFYTRKRLKSLESWIYFIIGCFISYAVIFAVSLEVLNPRYYNMASVIAAFFWPSLIIVNYIIKKIVAKKNIATALNGNTEIFYKLKNSGAIIPTKYWSKHALERFTEYLTTFRADTLKECVQLYEKELMHNQTLNKLNQMDIKLSRISDEITDIADMTYIKMFHRR